MSSAAPTVVTWYARYCQASLALLSVASLSGIYFFAQRHALAERLEVDGGIVALFAGLWTLTLLFLAFVHYAALRTPRAPWAWKIHAVVLLIGLTTLVLWPVALPLLWFWLKPETKAFFGVAPQTT